MNPHQIADLKAVVEQQHDCLALFRHAELIEETFNGEVAWKHEVATFDVTGNALANVCYAWREERSRRTYAVLGVEGIDSPRDAVRASIAAEL